MAEPNDLMSQLLGGLFSSVLQGGQTALTRTLLNQIDPGRAARFEVLPPTQAGAAQTALFGRLAEQEPVFAGLRNKPLDTTPQAAVDTTLRGITPGLTRTFQETTLPNLQAAFAQAGAGSSGRLAGESERLFRTNVSEPAAEAAARTSEAARQFNETQLLQRFLGSLLPQQVAASIRPEERNILGFPAEPSLFDQTQLPRLLQSLGLGGAGTTGGAAASGINVLASALGTGTSALLAKLLPSVFGGSPGSPAALATPEAVTAAMTGGDPFSLIDPSLAVPATAAGGALAGALAPAVVGNLAPGSIGAAATPGLAGFVPELAFPGTEAIGPLGGGAAGFGGFGLPTAPGAVQNAAAVAAGGGGGSAAAGLSSTLPDAFLGLDPAVEAALFAEVGVPEAAGFAGLVEAASSAFAAVAPTLPFLALAAPTLIRAFTGNPATPFEMGGGNVTREADDLARAMGVSSASEGNPWVSQRQDGSVVWATTPEAQAAKKLVEAKFAPGGNATDWRNQPWAQTALESIRKAEIEARGSDSPWPNDFRAPLHTDPLRQPSTVSPGNVETALDLIGSTFGNRGDIDSNYLLGGLESDEWRRRNLAQVWQSTKDPNAILNWLHTHYPIQTSRNNV